MSRRGLLLIASILICGATYAPILTHEFVGWDDFSTIAGNDRLRPPSTEGAAYYWMHPAGGLYIPVTYTAWSLLAMIAQRTTADGSIRLVPWVFHAASMIVHMICTGLVFDLLLRFVRNDVAALMGALLFALHPLQVESVAWASGLKDLLCGMFTLIAVWCYWMRAGERQGNAFYVASIAAVVLAMLSKPTGMMAPLIIAAVDIWIIGRPMKRVISQVLPMLLLSIPILIITRMEQTAPEITYTPPWTRPLIALDSTAFYLRKLVLPMLLSPVYGRAPQTVVAWGSIYYIWIVPALVAFGVVLARKRHPLLVVAAIVFLAGLLPVLGITRFMFQKHSTVADHYMYLPLFGAALAAAEGARVWAGKQVYAMVWLTLAALGAITIVQQRCWRDSIALFARAVQVTPDDSGAQGNEGRALAQAGRLTEALPYFERAVELSPGDIEERMSLVRALLLTGRLDAAEQQLAEAARRSPEDVNLAAQRDAVRARRLASPATSQ